MKYEGVYSNRLMTRLDSPSGFTPNEYTPMGHVEANSVQDLFSKLNRRRPHLPALYVCWRCGARGGR
jgi:hypothetical protein